MNPVGVTAPALPSHLSELSDFPLNSSLVYENSVSVQCRAVSVLSLRFSFTPRLKNREIPSHSQEIGLL